MQIHNMNVCICSSGIRISNNYRTSHILTRILLSSLWYAGDRLEYISTSSEDFWKSLTYSVSSFRNGASFLIMSPIFPFLNKTWNRNLQAKFGSGQRSLSIHLGWLHKVPATFATKGYFQKSGKRSMPYSQGTTLKTPYTLRRPFPVASNSLYGTTVSGCHVVISIDIKDRTNFKNL